MIGPGWAGNIVPIMAHCIVPEAELILDREFPVLDRGFVRLVDYLGGDDRIVQAARVSYGEGTKALRENKERLETMLHSLPFGILIMDTETLKIVDANPQAVLMIGAPADQIIGSDCHKFICPTEKRECPVTDPGQDIDNSERELLTATGEKLPVLKTAIPIELDGRNCLIECFIDITDRKHAEAERMGREKLQGIIEMSGAVCHELNQPLQSISTYSELLMMDMKKEDQSYGQIEKIKGQVDRMGEITKKLMRMTKYETKGYLRGKIIDIDKASK